MTESSTIVPLNAQPNEAVSAVLKFMYVLAAGWAVMALVFVVLLPWRIKMLGFGILLPWLPFAAATLFVRSVYADSAVLEFTDTAVLLRAKAAPAKVAWRDATSLSLPTSFRYTRARTFPRVLVLKTDRDVDSSPFGRVGTFIGLEPGAGEIETDMNYLSELLRRAPVHVIDPEVSLLLGLEQRALARGLGRSGSWSEAALELLHSPSPETVGITAPLEYFLGNAEKASAQCDEGLAAEPGAWDLLLCRALCQRDLGNEGAWRASLREALDASPPPEVAPVLALAAGSE